MIDGCLHCGARGFDEDCGQVRLIFLLDRLRAWSTQGSELVAPPAIIVASLIRLGQSSESLVGGLWRGLLPEAD